MGEVGKGDKEEFKRAGRGRKEGKRGDKKRYKNFGREDGGIRSEIGKLEEKRERWEKKGVEREERRGYGGRRGEKRGWRVRRKGILIIFVSFFFNQKKSSE